MTSIHADEAPSSQTWADMTTTIDSPAVGNVRGNGLLPGLYLKYSRAHEHPMKMRVERWMRRLLRVSIVRAASPWGVWYDLRADDFVQAVIIRYGLYEPNTLQLMRSLLAPGDIMVDLGAHVGQFGLHAAQCVGPDGRVVVVEPNPETYQRLLRNIQLNRFNHISAVLGAVANKSGVSRMVVPYDIHTSATFISASAVGARAFNVLTMPLQPMLQDLHIDRITVLKMDVEGCESFVLDSLDLDSSLRPRHIVFEYNPPFLERQGTKPLSLLDRLRDAAYELRDVRGQPLVHLDDLLEANIWARDLRQSGCVA